MRIGVDLDNTIACYDRAFHRAARGRGLIPAALAPTKFSVRDHLCRSGRERDWTELQGYVYGPGMAWAEAFPGVRGCFRRCRRAGYDVCIISHRTRVPYAGPSYDLHAAAAAWLRRERLLPGSATDLSENGLWLEETRERKLERIREAGCDVFVDDLPEFLGDPAFPGEVRAILFDPHGVCTDAGLTRVSTWRELGDDLLAGWT